MATFPGRQTYAEDLPPSSYTEGKRNYKEERLVPSLSSNSVDVRCSRDDVMHNGTFVCWLLCGPLTACRRTDIHRECSLRMVLYTKKPELR